MRLEAKRLSAELVDDFFTLHTQEPFGWCYCVAWEIPTWEAWNSRTAEKNKMLRQMLFERKHLEGYLLYLDDKPVGWCQCGPRDRWVKLVKQYELQPDKEMYAITCFTLLPQYRKLGLTHQLLGKVVEDLKSKNIKRVQGFPHKGEHSDEEVWTGPENVFLKAGFHLEKDDPIWPVYRLEL